MEIEITYFLETSYHDSTMAQIGMTPNEVELTIPSYVTSGMLTINISKILPQSETPFLGVLALAKFLNNDMMMSYTKAIILLKLFSQ